jgi:hypothetical protein
VVSVKDEEKEQENVAARKFWRLQVENLCQGDFTLKKPCPAIRWLAGDLFAHHLLQSKQPVTVMMANARGA